MYTTIEGIALRTVRHSDRTSILTVYSRQMGRLALSVPAGKGRGAARMRALLMPLGRFECQADIRPGRDIFAMRDVRPLSLPPASHPAKAAVAMFMADFLGQLLREPQPDEALFLFISEAAERLERETRPNAIANFHVCFLVRLLRFVGIEPDWSTYSEGSVFDYLGGRFRLSPPTHGRFLPTGEALAAHRLGRIDFDNSRFFRFSRFERNLVADRLLDYYRTHLPTISEPASLGILRATFD